jgi:hypothetical protein
LTNERVNAAQEIARIRLPHYSNRNRRGSESELRDGASRKFGCLPVAESMADERTKPSNVDQKRVREDHLKAAVNFHVSGKSPGHAHRIRLSS